MVHPNPFRDPAFGGPRFIATKRENPRPGYNSSIVQNFTPVGITDADVYLSWTKICLISAIGYTSVWQITIMAIVFFILYQEAITNSNSYDSRYAFDKVHLCLVADAGEICVHCLTQRTSCRLISHSRRHIKAAATVVMPVGRT